MDTSTGFGAKQEATANVVDNRVHEFCDENMRLNELLTKYQKKMHEAGLEVINYLSNQFNSLFLMITKYY